MGEKKQSFQEMGLRHIEWAPINKDDEYCESSSINDSLPSSSFSSSSSCSPELADDASSSSTSSSNSPPSCGPLYELADLMAQLPIKRGLSKFYNGKSQTFGFLENVKSVEDLAKKESCYSRRMKSCKSYEASLNHHKFGPKATITKKSSRRSFSPKDSLGTTKV
ncbi:hypothetical protein CDL12_13040 [Handroanthus impetiginosus]|uniref:Oxidative stress 3 n=1 Tax=Handroanthus impetiginosus TaxID=429701 RepID=A0A2G9H9Z8_9LAMI|nr:hypothetical protein CDL12_13040 [Handroanthus impetiginosus]